MNNYIGIFIRKAAHSIGLAVIFAMTFLVILNSDIKAASLPDGEFFTDHLKGDAVWCPCVMATREVSTAQKESANRVDQGVEFPSLVAVNGDSASDEIPDEGEDGSEKGGFFERHYNYIIFYMLCFLIGVVLRG